MNDSITLMLASLDISGEPVLVSGTEAGSDEPGTGAASAIGPVSEAGFALGPAAISSLAARSGAGACRGVEAPALPSGVAERRASSGVAVSPSEPSGMGLCCDSEVLGGRREPNATLVLQGTTPADECRTCVICEVCCIQAHSMHAHAMHHVQSRALSSP